MSSKNPEEKQSRIEWLCSEISKIERSMSQPNISPTTLTAYAKTRAQYRNELSDLESGNSMGAFRSV